ncbi:MAG: hypothetical protein G8345_15985 [Magnetococcales bacterium]|nr:hypothetical protein [Magnetococcales bacterium]NGZ28374.1 hypothetical protein [Magnetococcales bacterium]
MSAPLFLHACQPTVKLIGFISLSLAIMGVSPGHPVGWWAFLAVVLAMWGAGISWTTWWRLLRRLLILFISLILFHGFFIPGHWIWSILPTLTWEGVQEGGKQCVRLIFLASLAWSLSASSSPMQLVAIGYSPVLCQRFPAWRRGLALLAMTLHMSGRLLAAATAIRESLYLRQVDTGLATWGKAGHAMLEIVVREVHLLEESLTVRGFDRLPLLVEHSSPTLHWRDGLVLFISLTGWLLWLW